MLMLIGFFFKWGLRIGKTTKAEFRLIEKYTLFLNREIIISCFKLAFEGKVTFSPI